MSSVFIRGYEDERGYRAMEEEAEQHIPHLVHSIHNQSRYKKGQERRAHQSE